MHTVPQDKAGMVGWGRRVAVFAWFTAHQRETDPFCPGNERIQKQCTTEFTPSFRTRALVCVYICECVCVCVYVYVHTYTHLYYVRPSHLVSSSPLPFSGTVYRIIPTYSPRVHEKEELRSAQANFQM